MLTIQQMEEWSEFYALEPWGFPVEDARMGMVCSSVFGAAGAKDAAPSKFMFGPKNEPEDLATRIKRAFGAPR